MFIVDYGLNFLGAPRTLDLISGPDGLVYILAIHPTLILSEQGNPS
jgi:hypothetical protein